MPNTYSFYDMQEALQLPGCPVCRLKAGYVERFVDNLLYEKVNDPGLRDWIREARGFCPEHSMMLVRRGAALGVSIIMQDVLRDALANLDEPLRAPTAMQRVRRLFRRREPCAAAQALAAALAPEKPCLICTYARYHEANWLGALHDNLGESSLLADYQASDGLCLPHLLQALGMCRSDDVLAALVQTQSDIWTKLEGQLGETIRKFDYRFLDEPPGEEAGAWQRALAVLAGERDRSGCIG